MSEPSPLRMIDRLNSWALWLHSQNVKAECQLAMYDAAEMIEIQAKERANLRAILWEVMNVLSKREEGESDYLVKMIREALK